LTDILYNSHETEQKIETHSVIPQIFFFANLFLHCVALVANLFVAQKLLLFLV